MKELRYTLLSDGSSDRALLPILTWLLRQHLAECAIQAEWADLRRLRRPPKTLAARIRTTLELFACDLLLVHRDAERETHALRSAEIREAAADIAVPIVCVVPIRMQEAWLLFDEKAIRSAAGNPRGDEPLSLPHITTVEAIPDPKNVLFALLRDASGLQGRRRKRFSAPPAVHRIAELIANFTPLRTLPAFQALEEELARALAAFRRAPPS
jgi:hypothetical protein